MSLWKETSRELVTKSFLFRMFRVGFRSEKSGREGKFDVLETKDWVNVIPLTEQGEVLMVEQFRFGVGEVTLEFPAGAIEPGQTPLEAAKRELREETGGECASIEMTGQCHPNPAFLNNHCFHFVAKGVGIAGAQKLDEHEEIELKKFSVEEVEGMITSGKIKHSLSIAAWYFYRASL